jgi:Domain of unknown function (DUF4349)
MPASETVDFEREFEELVRELRALPTDAPASVRERVRALGEPAPRRVFPQLTWRRAVVALVPACVVAVVAAAAIRGIVSSSSNPTSHVAAEAVKQQPNENGRTQLGKGKAGSGGAVLSGKSRTPVFGAVTTQQDALGPTVPTPNPARHQDYQADLRVRVKDLDALGDKTAQAMQITQQLGGYVASLSQTSNAGQPGESVLVLRVPVARVTDAMVRLSALGTVLEQHVSIVDLENAVRQQRERIRALKLQIVRITAALQQPGLSTDERLRLQFQLDDARRNLASVTGQNKATLREAALSRIAFYLTTQKPIATTKKHDEGFFGRAVSSAVDFLAGAGAITVAALIILSPLLVLAVLIWLGVRTYRRREAQRLLGTT